MCCGGGDAHCKNAVVAFTIPACTSSGAAEGTVKNEKTGKTRRLCIRTQDETMDNSLSITVFVRLYDHRIGRLALDRLEERHQKEIVLGVLAQVGQRVRFRLTVVHHHRHHVVRLRATGQVSEPYVYAFYPIGVAQHLPDDPDRRGRHRKQFFELDDFGAEPLSGLVQRLLRDHRVGAAGFHRGGQRAGHAQTVRVLGPHHEYVRRVRLQVFHLHNRYRFRIFICLTRDISR